MYGLPASGKITFAMSFLKNINVERCLKPSQKYRNLMFDAQLNGEFNSKEEAVDYFLANGKKYGIELFEMKEKIYEKQV